MSTLAATSLALIVGISQLIWLEGFVKGHIGSYLSFSVYMVFVVASGSWKSKDDAIVFTNSPLNSRHSNII